MSSAGILLANEGFHPPGPLEFFLPDFTGTKWNESGYLAVLGKAGVLLLLAAVISFVLLYLTSRRAAVVPGKGQFFGESAYGFIRDGLAKDIIGSDFMRWVPLLVSLFFFLLVNNLFGIVPFFQFPPFSRVSYAYGLAAMVWLLYNGIGMAKQGVGGYFKNTCVPSGVPGWILPLLVPLEFLSNIIVRPITLSLRLFANMFAGHLLIILFSTGGAYLLLHAEGSFILKPAGVLSYVLGIAIGFLEVIVALLQAYVFTLLTALYISGAMSSEH